MNAVKKVIQKEEYIALSVNKYILQTRKLPKDKNGNFDWSVLTVDDYLGSSFNKHNNITKTNFVITFDDKNNIFIKGALQNRSSYDEKNSYLYNFYTNRVFRVNTLPPKSILKTELEKGSQVLYPKLQKELVSLLSDNKEIRLDSEVCPKANFFYELKDKNLTYKYCRDDYSFPIYQEAPVYVENTEDLSFIKANIGDKGYAKKNGKWYEYYYQGDFDIPWVPVESGSILNSQDEEEDIEDRIISYIPDAKDLILKNDGGCMLANGDIFCWGNNKNKKAGIESFGQLNPSLKPDFINTPVMLKVQIDNTTKVEDDSGTEYTRRDKKWYNNPYRIKFEKMALNSTNVCAISPIFDYFQSGSYKKFGGDLYCNGKLLKAEFEDIDSSSPSEITTSILKRNKFFAREKDDEKDDADKNEIYLKDVVMVDGAIAVLSDAGKVYTFGVNVKGVLGINNANESFIQTTPIEVTNSNNALFKEIFALRDFKTFAALDENNNFWIWGERHNKKILKKPTLINTKKYDANGIFVNSSDFVLRGLDKIFYRTYDISSVKKLSNIPSTALSVSLNSKSFSDEYLYIDENKQLQGTSTFKTCKSKSGSNCTGTDKEVFNLAFNKLNELLPSTNNKEYASFSNIGIFSISDIAIDNKFTTVKEDFESGISGWDTSTRSYGNSDTGYFMGRFGGTWVKNKIKKTYDFGKENKNKKVKIKFDFYEIDSWDNSGNDYFKIKINNSTKNTFYNIDWSVTNGVALAPIGNSGSQYFNNDEKIAFEYIDYLDNNGKIKLEFESRLDQDLNDESWGIDNIEISDLSSSSSSSSKLFVCAMTGLGSKSQMYCWGEVGRSLPIMNTSLYNIDKVNTLNKLFVTQKADVNKQMSFDEFNNSGQLFLKYPTYIGGFDYEFYFK